MTFSSSSPLFEDWTSGRGWFGRCAGLTIWVGVCSKNSRYAWPFDLVMMRGSFIGSGGRADDDEASITKAKH